MSELDALDAAARAFVHAVEEPAAPVVAMLAVVANLLGCAAAAQDLANEPGARLDVRPSVTPRAWSVDGSPDPLRRAMHAVYSDDDDGTKARVEREVAELYAAIAPFVRALEAGTDRRTVLRTLAWEVQNAWGHAAAVLVRPLWELAPW